MTTRNETWNATQLTTLRRRGVVATDGGLQLRDGVTLTDEAGRCNIRDTEWIGGLRQARKHLLIDGPVTASSAKLCVYLRCDTPGGTLTVDVNDHSTAVTWQEKREYWVDAWHPIDIDPSWLRSGMNTVRFRVDDTSRWSLLVEESRQPDRSEVSDDGGQTWRSEEMGENDRADGEYLVRLWLEQHEAAGQVTSDVVDLLQADGSGIACAGQVSEVSLACDADQPAGTSVHLFWRAGSTPAYDPATWSAWAPAEGSVTGIEGRFLQWQARLATDDPSQTPRLTGARLTATVDVADSPTRTITDADNRPLVYGSYGFSYLNADDPRGKILRQRWQLDKIVGPAKTEFEALSRLSKWVREQWEDGWDMGELNYCPPWDAALILELAGQKLSLGMCTHYATVFTQCCAALGFTARTLVIKCHCVSEVWSNDYGKWVTMDTGGDSNDKTKYTYHFERDGIPLSARETHEAWVTENLQGVSVSPPAPAAATGHTVEKRIHLWERFMMNPRNDEPVTLGPGEPENGKGAYHYDGYLHWEDEHTQPLPWYSRHTERVGDYEWDVDSVQIHLQAAGDALQVDLEGVSPHLERFEVRIDGSGWEARPARFEWNPGTGEHRLEARVVNGHGRAGRPSAVTVG